MSKMKKNRMTNDVPFPHPGTAYRSVARVAGTTAAAGILIITLLAGMAGCKAKHGSGAVAATELPRVETVRHNAITLVMTLTPGSVALDRDIILSLQLTHPESIAVSLPPLADRLHGLLATSSFDRETTPSPDGRVTRERVIRLTPLIAQEYRIAPMPVAFRNAVGNGKTDYFATPPLTLPLNAVTDQPLDDALRGEIRPLPIHPSLKTLSGYVAFLVLLALLMAVAIHLLGRIQRKIRILRMSPKERALHELELLLAKKLVEAGRIKDFYVELTMIVRRYIERRHRVRAPEQTTQEFLSAVSADTRFPPHVVSRLQQFLEAADLVKFAAWKPDSGAVENAVATARGYLTSDAEAADADLPAAPGKE